MRWAGWQSSMGPRCPSCVRRRCGRRCGRWGGSRGGSGWRWCWMLFSPNSASGNDGMSDTGDDLKAAWQRHAAARQRFQEMAVRSVPLPKVMEYAKRLGLQVDRELAQVSEAELAYAF